MWGWVPTVLLVTGRVGTHPHIQPKRMDCKGTAFAGCGAEPRLSTRSSVSSGSPVPGVPATAPTSHSCTGMKRGARNDRCGRAARACPRPVRRRNPIPIRARVPTHAATDQPIALLADEHLVARPLRNAVITSLSAGPAPQSGHRAGAARRRQTPHLPKRLHLRGAAVKPAGQALPPCRTCRARGAAAGRAMPRYRRAHRQVARAVRTTSSGDADCQCFGGTGEGLLNLQPQLRVVGDQQQRTGIHCRTMRAGCCIQPVNELKPQPCGSNFPVLRIRLPACGAGQDFAGQRIAIRRAETKSSAAAICASITPSGESASIPNPRAPCAAAARPTVAERYRHDRDRIGFRLAEDRRSDDMAAGD